MPRYMSIITTGLVGLNPVITARSGRTGGGIPGATG
jgi:hypothetical protein